MNRRKYAAYTALCLICVGLLGCGSRPFMLLGSAPAENWQYSGEFQVGSIAPFPNRSAIAYSFSGSGPSHIYTVSWDGKTTHRLTKDTRADSDVCVSPNGKFLVFVRQDGDTLHLWRMNINGTGQRQLTFGPNCETEPTISPNGRKIAYVTSVPTDGSTFVVAVMNANGTKQTTITRDTATAQDTTPVFDPTGTRVCFSHAWLEGPDRMEIWAVSLAGKGERIIGYGNHPTISPNGKRIVFLDQLRNQTLGIMNANGTGRTIIGRNVGYGGSLRYSSDGRHLLLVTTYYDTGTIWSVSTSGMGQQKIVTIQ